MSRGRKPDPTRVLKIRGSFDKHPERAAARADEPVLPLGVGDPPTRFDAGQIECWNELASDGAEWLTRAYRPPLEVAAFLLAQWRRAGGGLKAQEFGLYLKACSDLNFGAANAKAKMLKRADDGKAALLA